MKIFGSNRLFFLLLFFAVCNLYSMSSRPLYVTPSDKYYIVKPGDTLSGISRKYGISVENLKLYNNLENDRILIGQKIYFEPHLTGKWIYITEREIPENKKHVVKAGDTLPLIAKMYGLDLLELIHYNTLTSWELTEGDIIYLSESVLHEEKPVKKKETENSQEIVTKQPTEKSKEKKDQLIEKKDKKIQVADMGNEFCQPVDSYMITRRFNQAERHQGIDLAAPMGTPIYAALSGKVIYAGVQKGYGNLVILEHENRLMTVYAHNETNLVATGEFIQAGDQIATMGSTGRSTGNHLHFEIRNAGQPLDPEPYLTGKRKIE